MSTWPQFSYPYDGIVDKLNTWGGNNSPMPYASGKGGVSGLMPWIRVISAYGCEDENGSAKTDLQSDMVMELQVTQQNLVYVDLS
jgi:hypothetical protein